MGRLLVMLIIQLLLAVKVFALFPTEEMLKDPLFDSVFVLHNEEEKRVDDSLYAIYKDRGDYAMVNNCQIIPNDPRFSPNIRKIIPVQSVEINSKIRLSKRNPNFLELQNYNGLCENESDIIDQYLREMLGKKGMSFYDSLSVDYNYDYAPTPNYLLRTNINPKNKVAYYIIHTRETILHAKVTKYTKEEPYQLISLLI